MTARHITTIVVGVDASDHSRAVLEWVVRMAKGMGCDVVAVHAYEIPLWFSEPYLTVVGPQEYSRWWSELARVKVAFQDEWCKPLEQAGVRYRTVMESGNPASLISRTADQVDADVVVVGFRGIPGAGDPEPAGVCQELVRNCKQAVLVIPKLRPRTLAMRPRGPAPARSKL
jgi:nucleotide-binding universal stress UspA family protein